MNRHTKDVLIITAGLTAIAVVTGLCVLWLGVEIAAGVTLLQTGNPFLGVAMLVIAGLNAVVGLVLIGREL